MDHPKADEIEWVVLLEGADPAATSAAARALFKASRGVKLEKALEGLQAKLAG